MLRRAMLSVCLLSLVGLLTLGCQQQTETTTMTLAERPAELDRLNMWTGHWRTVSEMKPVDTDETKTATADDEWRWACDRRVLINEWTGQKGEENTKGIGLWTWDPFEKQYVIWQVDSTSMIVTGTATFDESDQTWEIEGTIKDPNTGKTRTFEANATMAGANTIEFIGTTWHSAWKLKKAGEFTSTMRRK